MPTYNDPRLEFPTFTGLTFDGVQMSGNLIVPLTLTTYSPVNAAYGHATATMMPGDGGIGAGAALMPSIGLPQIRMEGHIDNNVTESGGMTFSRLAVDGIRHTYADLIAMYWEGRVGNWQRVQPSLFRDPYGREWVSTVIMDFAASYVEASPQRQNFTMVLKV